MKEKWMGVFFWMLMVEVRSTAMSEQPDSYSSVKPADDGWAAACFLVLPAHLECRCGVAALWRPLPNHQ